MKVNIEGFKTGNIVGCEGTVREEGRVGKLSIEGFKTGSY
jgi:hypothetical protein